MPARLHSSLGARRSSTALSRFKDSSQSADVELQVAPPTDEQLEALESIDEVAGVAVLQSYGILLVAAPDFVGVVVPDAASTRDTVDRDRIVAGGPPTRNRPTR